MFTIHIKMHIDRLAGEKTVELAKQPKPVPEREAAVANTDSPAQTMPPITAKVNIKQEYRRGKIDERNRKILSKYRKLLKQRPGMSDVWYSRQLSSLEISHGLDAETIRKIIRD